MDPRRYYTPYIRDSNDIARRRRQESWIVTKILTIILVVGMVCAAFMVSPFMGVPMVAIMLVGVFHNHNRL